MILSILAISLGRGANTQLMLAERMVNKTKARYLTWAGFHYALVHIAREEKDHPVPADDLFRCGVQFKKTESPEEIFGNVKIPGGHFDVAYDCEESHSPDSSSVKSRYGFRDEERKLNLNALTVTNDSVFKELLVVLGADETTAATIAASSVDWHDEDDRVSAAPFGEEGVWYESRRQPYQCKNRPFDQVDELLLVKGMTLEIFEKIQPFVTVFPKNAPRLTINFATAFPEVLIALANSMAFATNTDRNDAQGLVKKLLHDRAGDDGQEATSDDRQPDFDLAGFNEKERSIFLAMAPYSTRTSRFIRISVHSGLEASAVRSCVEAVVDRESLNVVAWRRQ